MIWAVEDSLYLVQESLKGVLANFPAPGIGSVIKLIIFPLGTPYSQPSDRTGRHVARILLTENESRNRLVSGVYISDQDDASGRVHSAFHLALTSTNAENAIHNALNEPVTYENYEVLVQKAVESGVITEEQATTVRLAQEATRAVVQVDEFTQEEIEGSKTAFNSENP